MQRIVPHAWCNRTNAAAAELYCAALPNTSVINTLHYPTTGLPEFQESDRECMWSTCQTSSSNRSHRT